MSNNNIKKFALSITIGTGIGILTTAVLVFMMAAALTIGDVPVMLISPIAIVFLALGGFFGGFSSARLSGEKGFLCGTASGMIFFLTIWATGSFFDNSGLGTAAFIKAVMIIIAGAFGGIIGVNYIKRK